MTIVLSHRQKNNFSKFKYKKYVWKFFFEGSINAYRFGKVQAGYMVGALVAEVYDNPNPDPGACNTKTGVTELKSDFVTLTFKKGNEGFTCWGKNILRFKPGLRNPKFWTDSHSNKSNSRIY